MGANHKSFQPGNPGGPGRKPGKTPEKAARERFKKIVDSVSDDEFREALSDCYRRAMKGSSEHLKIWLSYTVGKPRQQIEIEGGQIITGVRFAFLGKECMMGGPVETTSDNENISVIPRNGSNGNGHR